MLIPVPPSECMRAREAASARLDGELPELDTMRLDAHLQRCAACREFVAQAADVTARLRRAPLERPTVVAFEPRRRRPVPALRLQAAAAAVAVAAVGGSFVLGRALGGGAGTPVPTATAAPADASSVRSDSLEQHLLALLPHGRVLPMRMGTVVAL